MSDWSQHSQAEESIRDNAPGLLILDLMNTFMFNHDRFGPQEQYETTFLQMGGGHLENLREILDSSMRILEQAYEYDVRDVMEESESARAGGIEHSGEPDPEMGPETISHGDNTDATSHKRMEVRSRGHGSQPGMVPGALHTLLDEARSRGISLSQKQRIALNLTFAYQETGTIDELHRACLLSLSKRFRLVVLSNLWGIPFFCERVLKSTGLKNIFEEVYYSSVVGMRKPSREVFHMVCKKHDVAPEHCLMIGDNLHVDIKGALLAGIPGLWLSYGRPADFPVKSALDFPEATEMLLNC